MNILGLISQLIGIKTLRLTFFTLRTPTGVTFGPFNIFGGGLPFLLTFTIGGGKMEK